MDEEEEVKEGEPAADLEADIDPDALGDYDIPDLDDGEYDPDNNYS